MSQPARADGMMQPERRSDQATETHYSVWIMPDEPLREQLHSIIGKLAAEFDAVDFEPHVTIYSGPSDDEAIQGLAAKVAGMFVCPTLTPAGLDGTDSYTKSLFIRLEDSGETGRMFDALREGSARSSEYSLDPHLSLLYKTLSETKRAEICRTLAIPTGLYRFDRIRVIATEIPLTRLEQIRRWRTVFESPIG